MASTAHQQYLGQVRADSPVWRAVRETEGRVMLLGRRDLFPAFYHTDSGGYTEDPRVVFGTANMPALKPVRVDFASGLAPPRVAARRAAVRPGRVLLKHGISVGRVVALEVLERSQLAPRDATSRCAGLKGTATLRGNDLRRLVGYDTLKSTLFAVAVDGSIARFAGRGYGHGVGSTSGGAKTMADLGYDASDRSSSTTIRALRCSVHDSRVAGWPGRSVPAMALSWDDFARVDMRVGVVIDAQEFPEARRPAFKLWVDFGPLGVKRSSAQITERYAPRDLDRAPRRGRRQLPAEADRSLRLRGARARRLRRGRRRHPAAPRLRRAAGVEDRLRAPAPRAGPPRAAC